MSVCGTGTLKMMLSAFSREFDYPHYRIAPKGVPYYRASAPDADLPASVNTFALQRAIPSARGGVTSPSAHRSTGQ